MDWDDPAGPLNVLSQKALAEWENLLPVLEKSYLKALVFVSRKPLAGMDLKGWEGFKTKEGMGRFLDRAGGVFQRMKALKAVKIAVIHKTCLGAGLELALLCDRLLTSDSPEIRLGLPEVRLGLIPALGGTFHLPRRVGMKTGLNMILTGKTLPPREALQTGLVDEIIPAEILEKKAEEALKGNVPAPCLGKKAQGFTEGLTESFLGRSLLFLQASKRLQEKTKGFYPAPRSALKVIKKNRGSVCLKEALTLEKQAFLELAFGPESQNLIRLFLLKTESKKEGRLFPSGALRGDLTSPPAVRAKEAKETAGAMGAAVARSPHLSKAINDPLLEKNAGRQKDVPETSRENPSGHKVFKKFSRRGFQVGVLGAGVMGGGIAGLLADRGHKVRVRDVRAEALSRALRETEALWEKDRRAGRLSGRELKKKRDSLSFTTELSGFSQMDIVIEALPEDEDLKKKALQEIGAVLTPLQVTVTNTSSLKVGELAKAYPYPDRFLGMHFFHPVRKMPLVEIVRLDQSGESAVRRVFQLAVQLGKTPVGVKDSPGFIVNRLLLPYLSEALWLLTEGYSVCQTDRLWRDEFGFPVGPFQLMDEVGPELCLKAAENFKRAGSPVYFPEKAPELLRELSGGRKKGEGFYIYGRKPLRVNEKVRRFQKDGLKPSFDECVKRGLYRLINGAVQMRKEGTARQTDIDLALTLGAGFPPFLGGPLKYAGDRGFSLIGEELRKLADKRGRRFHPHPAFFR